MESEFDRKVDQLLKKESAFSSEAYYFMSEAVNFTVDKHQRQGHVSAAELLCGIREFAGKKFGIVAEEVLASWGMISEADAGKVVFLLIGVGLLRASEDDSPEDFNTGNPLFSSPETFDFSGRKKDSLPFID